MNPAHVRTCLRCPERRRLDAARVVCSRDGVAIGTHAARAACPLGRFDFASLPPPMPIPDDYDPEHERRRLESGGCCGAPAKP